MPATKNQVDNLVALLDGYAEKGGHHLNVNVFTKEQREKYGIEKVWGDCNFLDIEE